MTEFLSGSNEVISLNNDHFFKSPFRVISKKGTEFTVHALVNNGIELMFYGTFETQDGFSRVGYISMKDIESEIK